MSSTPSPPSSDLPSGIQVIIDPLLADQYLIRHHTLGPVTSYNLGVQEHSSSLVFKIDEQGDLSADVYTLMRDPLTLSGWRGVASLQPVQSIVSDLESVYGVVEAFAGKDITKYSSALPIIEVAIRQALSQAGYELFNSDTTQETVACPNAKLLSGKKKLIAILSEQSVVLNNPLMVLTAATKWSKDDEGWERDVHVMWRPEEIYDEAKHGQAITSAREWVKEGEQDLSCKAEDKKVLIELLIRHQAKEQESLCQYMNVAV